MFSAFAFAPTGAITTLAFGVPASLTASCSPPLAEATVYPALCVFAAVKIIVPDVAPDVQVPPVTTTASGVPCVARYTEYGAAVVLDVSIPVGHGVSVTVFEPADSEDGEVGAWLQLNSCAVGTAFRVETANDVDAPERNLA